MRVFIALAIALLATLPSKAQSWTKLSTKTVPPGRAFHSMTYDLMRGRILMFGDLTPSQTDTWAWSNRDWTLVPTVMKPKPARDAAMVYDRSRMRTLLFGGRARMANQVTNENWEFDGSNWKQLFPTNSPSPRSDAAVAYDARRRRTVLFSGRGASKFRDTWEWDGVNWRQVATTSPLARIGACMTYDTLRGVCVMFGGRIKTDLDETWEYNGTAWKKINLPLRPAGRWNAAMTYDLKRGVCVLYGGRSNSANKIYSDTWEYNGKSWKQIKLAGPGPLWGAAMEYDATRSEVILFGGIHMVGGQEKWDTWRYSGSPSNPAAYTPIGKGCGGKAGVPSLAALPGSLPYINGPFTIYGSKLPVGKPASLIWGLSRTKWAGFNLPMNLGLLSMPGCNLYSSIEIVQGLNHNGTVRVALNLPNNPYLINKHFYNQILTFDKTANPGGNGLSNGADATIGKR